jgi:glycosyltransferase involved in cell wall biosynthesis
MFSKKPYITSVYVNRNFTRRIERVIEKGNFDVVHCDSISLGKFIFSLRNRWGVRFFLNQHNVESVIWKRYAIHERNPAKRWYYQSQYERLRKDEAKVCKAFDGIIAVSQIDKGTLEKDFNISKVKVVENGVDTEYFKPQIWETEGGNNLLFCGSMDWQPNIDAASHFFNHCYGRIKKKLPNATFTIVGRNPSSLVRKLGNEEGVSVTGTVDDVRPYLSRCSLVVVPLRIGGGSRLKILEAMSMGKAVLSTSIGAEGLEVQDGNQIMLADDPVDFSEKCIDLLVDIEKRSALGKNGRNLVVKSYGWNSLAGKLVDVWASTGD